MNKLKDWLYPKSLFPPQQGSTHSILKTQIDWMMKTWIFGGTKTQTETKIMKALMKINARLLDLASKNPRFDQRTYDLLWKENRLHVYSSKYKHRVHNTAAMIFQERVLDPLKGKL